MNVHRGNNGSPSRFADRHHAGRCLAERLLRFRDEHPVVLALPRGGVPVGYEIARAMQAPLDVMLVRKLGAPGFAELGLGAVVDGANPQRILNEDVIASVQPPPGYLEAEERRQLEVIAQHKQRLSRGRAPAPIEGRSVILVDDGIATGGTVRVALLALARAGVRHTVLAVPVAPPSVFAKLSIAPQDFVCLLQPDDFQAVGQFYANFDQVDDAEVIELLDRARARTGVARPGSSGSSPAGSRR